VFIAVEELQEHPVRFDEGFAAGHIDYATTGLRQAGELKVQGVATLREREIHLRGKLAGALELECARCLEAGRQKVEREFNLFYQPLAESPKGEEIEVPRGEEDIAFFSGAGLLLEDVVREQVLLSLPMRYLCREDCRGLCPQCGCNRNRETCQCRPADSDPRWDALKRLRNQN
jgi:uncharacterized protein